MLKKHRFGKEVMRYDCQACSNFNGTFGIEDILLHMLWHKKMQIHHLASAAAPVVGPVDQDDFGAVHPDDFGADDHDDFGVADQVDVGTVLDDAAQEDFMTEGFRPSYYDSEEEEQDSDGYEEDLVPEVSEENAGVNDDWLQTDGIPRVDFDLSEEEEFLLNWFDVIKHAPESVYEKFCKSRFFAKFLGHLDIPITKKTLCNRIMRRFRGVFELKKEKIENLSYQYVNVVDVIRLWFSHPRTAQLIKTCFERNTEPYIDSLQDQLNIMEQAISSGSHVFGEAWTGLNWLGCLKRSENKWRGSYQRGDMIVHMSLFSDAFQTTKSSKTIAQEVIYLTLSEFPSWTRWSEDYMAILPICIVDKDVVNNVGLNTILSKITANIAGLSHGVPMYSAAHLDENGHPKIKKVFAVLHGVFGDLLGRAEIIGMMKPSVAGSPCNVCTVVRNEIKQTKRTNPLKQCNGFELPKIILISICLDPERNRAALRAAAEELGPHKASHRTHALENIATEHGINFRTGNKNVSF